MQYRRVFIPGGSYFFTVVTGQRREIFNDESAVDLLHRAFNAIRVTRPYSTDALAVLPDHLHCIWTLPPGDSDYSTRWRLIKTWFTKRYYNPETDQESKGNSRSIWQKRYWEHVIRDEIDYQRHVEYIHYNPVKHGYVSRPSAWKHSSFHRFIEKGIYGEEWGDTEIILPRHVGSE